MGIDKDISRPMQAAELRRRAEERLLTKAVTLHPPRTAEEIQRLLHEMQIHQIELEMQNAELRQARDENEKTLEKYTDLYDFAPVGYFTLDRNGAIGDVNFSGASLLASERSRLIGRRFGLFVTEEAKLFFFEFLGKVFASQGKQSCELMLTLEGISPCFVQIEAVAFASGQECRVAVINITERRLAEDALAETSKNLEELNRSLEESIAQAVHEIRQKDQMLIHQDRMAVMGEMINNIAHQWRQPLNTLGLIIQQLMLFYDSPVFGREFLEKNTGKGMELIQHMSQTIDDFKNFFKPDKETVAFSVKQVIERTLSLIEKSFQEQQISVDLQTEGDPVLNGYPNEYAQVLLNIVMNARDALVANKVDAARISLRAFAEGGKTVVTITDNAGGIAEEIMDKLFDPYFSTKGPDKGTGIGLFMSKSIIEKSMGGRLAVRNTGSGAEFRIEV